MWVVRDFTLKLEDANGNQFTSKQYLENGLASLPGESKAVKKKNELREKIRTFFQDRDCCTMVTPAEGAENLQNLSRTPLEQLKPEFQ